MEQTAPANNVERGECNYNEILCRDILKCLQKMAESLGSNDQKGSVDAGRRADH